jgi:uncharacterized FlgJ-related protein
MIGNITRWMVKTMISDLIEVELNGRVIVKHLLSDISSRKNIVNIFWKFKIESLGNESKAGLVPEWSNGVDCKSIIRRFESCPALKLGK